MVIIVNCFVTQAGFRCPSSRNKGESTSNITISPHKSLGTHKDLCKHSSSHNTCPRSTNQDPVTLLLFTHFAWFQCWKQGPRIRACWEQSHTDIVVFCCSKQQTSAQHQCNVVVALWDVRPQTTGAGKAFPIPQSNFHDYKAVLILHWGKTNPIEDVWCQKNPRPYLTQWLESQGLPVLYSACEIGSSISTSAWFPN